MNNVCFKIVVELAHHGAMICLKSKNISILRLDFRVKSVTYVQHDQWKSSAYILSWPALYVQNIDTAPYIDVQLIYIVCSKTMLHDTTPDLYRMYPHYTHKTMLTQHRIDLEWTRIVRTKHWQPRVDNAPNWYRVDLNYAYKAFTPQQIYRVDPQYWQLPDRYREGPLCTCKTIMTCAPDRYLVDPYCTKMYMCKTFDTALEIYRVHGPALYIQRFWHSIV